MLLQVLVGHKFRRPTGIRCSGFYVKVTDGLICNRAEVLKLIFNLSQLRLDYPFQIICMFEASACHVKFFLFRIQKFDPTV